MDGTRFDALTRSLAGSVSRRTALKGAMAALLSSGLLRTAMAAQQSGSGNPLPTLEPLPTKDVPSPTPTVTIPAGPTARRGTPAPTSITFVTEME